MRNKLVFQLLIGHLLFAQMQLGSDSTAVTGTGRLARIVFTTTDGGRSDITYTTACELLDPDDDLIVINGWGSGVIYAE